ncbi:Rha family transcriptional regulator [Paenibacillus sp. JDR-2]|uniref:Rha family transcriptional regulator n=1 Tax=Paenibacillus sp. (strain JDR-2) TaxID=324057 RepID=UPI000166A307|nr:Rha family transcriptional regulator [Paenibacillus sp. JDR-2]ACT00251.1 phage regulatory protein, Rha family [Paenibacillus sp. JDR-2]
MNQSLVFMGNGRPVTDSLKIAEVFGKEHKNVLRDIANLECSQEFSQLNFEPSDYTNERGRPYTKYLITQDGFSFLVMGYTGKEAARFKEMYIGEFNRMKETLNNPLAGLSPELQAILMIDKRTQVIEQRIEEVDKKVETRITLTQGEQRRIQKAVSSRVYDFTSETAERSELFRELYREIKDRWGVPSYRDILSKDMPAVLKYIDAWSA